MSFYIFKLFKIFSLTLLVVIIFSGSDQDEDPYIIERRRNRIQLDSVRSELKTLLHRPIFPRGFSFKYVLNIILLPI